MKRIVCLLLALLLVLSLCACGDSGSGGEETLPTEFEEIPGMSQRLPDSIHGSWHTGYGPAVDIYPDAVATPDGYFTDYVFHEDSMVIELLQDGQVVCTVCFVDERTVMTVDQEGNEMLFYSLDDTGSDDWQESMDEAEQLNMAYNKALNDFNAAISGQPVYDEEGGEITDGPMMARYLYDQFVALGAYEDAEDYLPLFKTRTEGVTTEHRMNYSYLGEVVYENTFDYDIPNYDVFGRPTNRDDLLFTYGIYGSIGDTDRMTLVRDENGIVQQVSIETYERVTVDGEEHRVEIYINANLKYDEKGMLVATHVSKQNSDGENSSYTTIFDYDSDSRLTRIYVPNVERGTYLANLSIMNIYDVDGKLLQRMRVLVPASQEEDIPVAKSVFTYHYDDHGLLEKEMSYSYDPINGGGNAATFYEYDGEGNLTKQLMYTVGSGFEDSGYSLTEYLAKTEGLDKATFYPTATDDAPTYDDWLVNVLIDLSGWDWIPYRMTLNVERCYSYSKTTTIMYIDLTPED